MTRVGVRWLLVTAATAVALSGCQSLRRQNPPPAVAPAPAPLRPLAPAQVIVRPTPPAPPQGSCVPRTLPGAPRYPDTAAALRAAAGAADRYQLLAAGRILRERRLDELERAILGCR